MYSIFTIEVWQVSQTHNRNDLYEVNHILFYFLLNQAYTFKKITPMEYSDLLGYTAGVLVTASFIPQTIKSWKTKSTGDLSLARYSMYTLGLFLWTIYGIIILSWPMIIMTSLDTLLAVSIVLMKLKYG